MTQIVQPTVRGAARPFEGVPFISYGHSFTNVPTAVATPNGGEWGIRLAQRMGMIGYYRGISGSKMPDVAYSIVANSGFSKAFSLGIASPATPFFLTVESMVNDIFFEANTADTTYQNFNFTEGLRVILAMAESASFGGAQVNANTASVTGTFGNVANATYLGGAGKQSTTTALSTMTWSNITAPAGYVYVLMRAFPATTVTAAFTISVDGSVVYTSAAGGTSLMKLYTRGPDLSSGNDMPYVIKVAVPNTGTHAIKITKNDATANTVNVNALLVPPTPTAIAPVLVLKDPSNVSSATATVGGTIAAAYTTYAPTYRSLIDTVVGQFSNAHSLDLNLSDWDTTGMIWSGDINHIHPNDKGMSWIADKVDGWMLNNLTPLVSGLAVI